MHAWSQAKGHKRKRTPSVASFLEGRENALAGEVAERSNAAVLKTVRPKGLGGSNPSLSATPIAFTRLAAANQNRPTISTAIDASVILKMSGPGGPLNIC